MTAVHVGLGATGRLFQNAALAAAREWTFRRASIRNRPVPSSLSILFKFNPRD